MKKTTRVLSAILLAVMLLSATTPCISVFANKLPGIVTESPTLNQAEPTYTRKYSFNDAEKDAYNDAMLNDKANYNGTKSFAEIYEIFKNEIKNNTNGYSFGTPTTNLASVSSAPWHDSSWTGTLPAITESHPRLLITRDNIPTVRKALEERNPTNERFFALLDMNVALPREYDSTGKPVDTVKNGVAFGGINSGKLKAAESNFDGRPGTHNYDKYYLEVIQVKALGYLIDGHELYGYQAIHCIKQMLRTLDIEITGNQEREYGNVMFTAALVYDWCYDLLDADDKNQLIAGVEYKVGKISNTYGDSFSVGFPPTKEGGSVTGHGSERQVLRDMLAAAIAFYGDNDSWWNYIGTLVYEKYVPVRNYYFRSGISQQGVGTYVSGRHIGDMFSAWLLMTSTGSQPYENIDKTVRNFLGYEITPGKIFTDGDGSGVTQSNTEFRALAYMTAYMFEDEAMLAQARDMLPNQAFGAGGMIDLTIEMHSALYVALTGMSDITPGDDKYAGMPLIQYNGSPVGQYVTHEALGVTDSASVFMKIKERMTSNHEHADAGNFMIYYKGMLTADGGVYKGYGSDHTRFYHQATVGHNSILVVNPNTSALTESESNIANIARSTKWYSGGQMWPAEADDLAALKTDTYKAGDVIGNRHGYYDEAKTQPKYAYLNGNIVYAYPSDTVDSLGRRMLTVYTGDEDVPMLFFVYDTIGAKAQSYTKKFLLQIPSSNAPTINTTNKTVTTINGDGKLVLTCMSPDTSIAGIGGRTYNTDGSIDLVNSKNYLINGSQNYPTGTTYDTGSWGRVEITATNASKSSKMLNAMYVTDATNTNTYSMKSITNVSSLQSSQGDFEGAVFEGKIAAVFAKKDVTGARTGTVSYMNKGAHSFTTEGNGTISYYVDGMEAGNWNVTVNGESVGTVKSSYGLLTFDAPAGEVVLTKESAEVSTAKAELLNALGTKISNDNGMYTADSYAAYSTAFDAIVSSINSAADLETLNAIDVTTLKANAEAKLVLSLNEKKEELIAALGAKKTNDNIYTSASYSKYSTSFDAIIDQINNATTMDQLNAIDVATLKIAAESKLVTLVDEKKEALIAALGAKKPNSGYSASSYAEYSAAYDEILDQINNATTMATLNTFDIPALKASIEALLQSASVDKDTITELGGSASKDVILSYDGNSSIATIVYSVDVTWTDVSFTYSEGNAQWNPEEHKYNSTVNNADWEDSTGEITVTNHSNAGVAINITFQQAATPNGTATLTITNSQYTLATAENTVVAKAPAQTSTITASGTPTSDAALGKLIITISAAS
ncbi:MAG: hypothetical protein E7678_00205 [Ruminococcaceae bacterium]|nr:hypothetical protein [Oscillospiraceae bacterium]